MTYYEVAGYENGTEIKQRMIEEAIRNLPSVRQRMETILAQEMGLVDEENAEAVAGEVAQRQQAIAPQFPGMNGAGGPPGGVGGPADLNAPLTPDTFNPESIDLAR